VLKLQGVSAITARAAISDVSIEIGEGEALGCSAPTAGKSTTLRVISGLVKLKAAPSYLTAPISPRCRRTGFRNWHRPCAGGRQVFLKCRCRRISRSRLCAEGQGRAATLDLVYGIFPRLADRKKQLAGTMSGGEQQMLAVGRGLMLKRAC